MSSTLNRRLFLGASLATSTVALGEVSWISWLSTDAAEAQIFAILQEYFGLSRDQRHLAKALIQRLRTPGLHTESPAAFQAMLRGKAGESELARYVVEEFIAGSNYLALLDGKASQLEIAKA